MSKIVMGQMGNSHEDGEVITKKKIKLKTPSKFKVLLHNDDYTTMEFVIFFLQKLFGKSLDEAQDIMLHVHNSGVGICGIYTKEIAETKVAQAKALAKSEGYPLKCTYERE